MDHVGKRSKLVSNSPRERFETTVVYRKSEFRGVAHLQHVFQSSKCQLMSFYHVNPIRVKPIAKRHFSQSYSQFVLVG